MTVELRHPMKAQATPEESARERLASGIRSLILNPLAAAMRSAFYRRTDPACRSNCGRDPQTRCEARRALHGAPACNM